MIIIYFCVCICARGVMCVRFKNILTYISHTHIHITRAHRRTHIDGLMQVYSITFANPLHYCIKPLAYKSMATYHGNRCSTRSDGSHRLLWWELLATGSLLLDSISCWKRAHPQCSDRWGHPGNPRYTHHSCFLWHNWHNIYIQCRFP